MANVSSREGGTFYESEMVPTVWVISFCHDMHGPGLRIMVTKPSIRRASAV